MSFIFNILAALRQIAKGLNTPGFANFLYSSFLLGFFKDVLR